MVEKIKKVSKEKRIEILLPLIITFLVNSAVYWGAPELTGSRTFHDLSGPMDDFVPLIPEFLLIYFGCYIFWVVNYTIVAVREGEQKYRFFTADFYARIICLCFFVFFPTTNTRPELAGSGIFIEGMRFLYQVDAPVNLFPSIHCMASWFCCIGLRGDNRIPKWYKILSKVIAIAVFISTLATKQHVFVDIIGGVAVAEITWFVSCHTNGWKIYQKFVCYLSGKGKHGK